MDRIVVVMNKWWECDPALAAMLNSNGGPLAQGVPAGTPWPVVLKPSQPPPETVNATNLSPEPRAIFEYSKFVVEVWCISDLLTGLSSSVQSSSEEKATRLPLIFAKGPAPALVIGLGTAASAVDDASLIGCVAVGTSVFLNNGGPFQKPETPSHWSGPFDTLVESTITADMFGWVSALDQVAALKAFLPMPLRPVVAGDPPLDPPWISLGLGDVGLGTLNVTDYHFYNQADQATLDSFRDSVVTATAVSLETTHGLIRLAAGESPFVFVSGIVNRALMMDTDAKPLLSAQDMAGAHNAGVVVSWMLGSLNEKWSG